VWLTPRTGSFNPGKNPVPTGWAPGPVWKGAENLAPTGIRSPDFPAVATRYTNWGFTLPLLYSSGMLNNVHWEQFTDISKYRTAWISVLLSCVNTRYSFSTSCSNPLFPPQTDSISVSRRTVRLLTYSYVNLYSLPVIICPTSLTFNNFTLCPHCIYVFCIYLITNSDLCHLQHKLIGFCNRDEKCLQRGTDWGFIYSGLSWVFKG